MLFPEKINGRYVRMDRPHSDISPWAIWVTFSEDLKYWGDSRVVMKPVTYHWDEMKIGPGAPPIKTPKGARLKADKITLPHKGKLNKT